MSEEQPVTDRIKSRLEDFVKIMGEETMSQIKVERTGNAYSIASVEYLVTYPDGSTERIWSPPWNDMTAEESDLGAMAYAKREWAKKNGIESVEAVVKDGHRSKELTDEWLEVFDMEKEKKNQDKTHLLADSVFFRLALHSLPLGVDDQDPRIIAALQEIKEDQEKRLNSQTNRENEK